VSAYAIGTAGDGKRYVLVPAEDLRTLADLGYTVDDRTPNEQALLTRVDETIRREQ
jgi:hypothetical protein